MHTQNVNIKTAAAESTERYGINDEIPLVFFRTETASVFSMALKLTQPAEYVALFTFTSLVELQRDYPDMVLIPESVANEKIDTRRAERRAKVEAILSDSPLAQQVRSSGHNFIRIEAGK